MLRTHSHTAKYKGVGMCVSLSPSASGKGCVEMPGKFATELKRKKIELSPECEGQIQMFIDHLRSTGRKESTLKKVTGVLYPVLRFMQSEGRPTLAEEITVEDFYFLRNAIPYGENTVHADLRQLSRYILYHTGVDLEKQADMLWNHVEPDRKFIDMDEFSKLLDKADPDMKAALLMGAMMGLRRAEICNARWSDIDRGRLTVYGKGHGKGKMAILDIPAEVMNALMIARDSRATRGRVNAIDDHLIQCLYHGVWGGFNPTSFSRKVNAMGVECGVDLTPHSLRRLYACTLHNDVGADLYTVKNLMRHEDISVLVNCYLKPCPTKRDKALAGLSERMSALF